MSLVPHRTPRVPTLPRLGCSSSAFRGASGGAGILIKALELLMSLQVFLHHFDGFLRLGGRAEVFAGDWITTL